MFDKVENEPRGVIYGIRDLTKDSIVYVGQTRNFLRRVRGYSRKATKDRKLTPVEAHYQEFGKSNFEFLILQEAPLGELDDLERKYIVQMCTLHPFGLNQMGGGRVSPHTEHAKAKISKNRTGILHTDATKKLMSELRKAENKNPELMEKRAEAMRNFWKSPEKRKARSVQVKTRLLDPEQANKLRQTQKAAQERNKGRAMSPEAKEKASLRLKQVWKDRPRKHSDATKAKISQTKRLKRETLCSCDL